VEFFFLMQHTTACRCTEFQRNAQWR